MFLGYWNNERATAAKFVGDWMTTGDQAVADSDGYVRFVGRDDDVITSSGYRIGPGEIEDCLLSHPAVRLAAAIGKPDPLRRGLRGGGGAAAVGRPDPLRTEIVKAFVVLRDGHAPSAALAADIQAHVRERLSMHEYPREIAFRADLPLTSSGKVIRRLLREEA